VLVEGAYTSDGGQTWNFLLLPFNLPDPTTSNPVKPFHEATNANVAFDRNESAYVVYSEHADNNASGAIVLQKYDFSGGSPAQTISNSVIYEWIQEPAFNPMLAVDNNLPTFRDVTTGAIQRDPFAGDVYVAWNTENIAPTGATGFNPNVIK